MTAPPSPLHRLTDFRWWADGGHGDSALYLYDHSRHHHEQHRLFLPVGSGQVGWIYADNEGLSGVQQGNV